MKRSALAVLAWAWLAAGSPAQQPASAPASASASRSLRARVTLTGDVRDVLGAPIAGASVAFTTPAGDRDLVRASSDGSGMFVLGGVPRDERGIVRVSARGYCPSMRPRHAGTPLEPLQVTLVESEPVTGVVRDREGRPLARAQVVAHSAGGSAEAWTDGEGRFSVDAGPGGSVTLFAYRSGYRLGQSELGAGTPRRHDLLLEADDGNETVLRVPGLTPADLEGGCSVALGPELGRPWPSELALRRLDARGEARYRGLPDGRYRVLVFGSDPWLLVEPQTVVLPAPQQLLTVARMELTREPFTGRVVDEQGAPVPGLRLLLRAGGLSGRAVTTDAEGKFAARVPIGSELEVVADSDDWRLAATSLQPEIKALPLLRIRGRVVDGAGNTIPNALVRVLPLGTFPGQTTRSLADGSFELRRLTPTPEDLLVLARTERFAGRAEQVRLTRDCTCTIRVEPAGELRGKLVHADGSPAANVSLRLMSVTRREGGFSAHDLAGGRTNRAGELRFDGLLPGRYALMGPAQLIGPAPLGIGPTHEVEIGPGEAGTFGTIEVEAAKR